jgi:hypothetical protein
MLPDANQFGWRLAFLGPVSSYLLEEVESFQGFFEAWKLSSGKKL